MLNGKFDQPPQSTGVVIRNIPGAEDFQFSWAAVTKRLTFKRLPDGPESDLAIGVPSRDIAVIIVQGFAAGLIEGSKTRMCKWPPEVAA